MDGSDMLDTKIAETAGAIDSTEWMLEGVKRTFGLHDYDQEFRFTVLPLFVQPPEVYAALVTDRAFPEDQRHRQTKLVIESEVVGDMAKVSGELAERNSLFVGISSEVTGIVFDRNVHSMYVMSRGEAVFSYDGPSTEALALNLAGAYIRGIF